MILFKKNKKNQIINWPVKYRVNFFYFLKKLEEPVPNQIDLELTWPAKVDRI